MIDFQKMTNCWIWRENQTRKQRNDHLENLNKILKMMLSVFCTF